jgi:hypothetical protein
MLAAEAALGRAIAERDAGDGADLEETLARIDREIHEHVAQRARASAVRDRRTPVLGRALAAVQAELWRGKPPIMAF